MKKELQLSDYVWVKMFPILYHLFIKERAYQRRQGISQKKITSLPVPPDDCLCNRVNDISQNMIPLSKTWIETRFNVDYAVSFIASD